MNEIEALLRPGKIAVIGASSDRTKMSGRPIAYLRKHGYAGAIYPVNPRVEEIDGLRCYPDVASLPETPDAAIIVLGPDRVIEATAALAARGTPAAVVLASGFGEGNAEGKARQAALDKAAGTMRILGPNTIGLVNVTDGITLSASGALEAEGLAHGSIGLVSQSGGILGSLLSRAVARGIGFSKLVATGNESDLDTADFLRALAEDDATRVVALYMEGLRRPAAFRAAAQLARAKGKPIVIFKVGRSEVGAQAAVSHTGALAGVDRVYDAFFHQTGIIRVTTFSDLLDVPAALAAGYRAAGNRIGVLTSTGGAATLIADACGLAGFAFPPPDSATAQQLMSEAQLDAESAVRNPVDVTLAGIKPELFKASVRAMMRGSAYDAVVVVIGSSALAQQDEVVQALREGREGSQKPLIAYVSPHAPNILRQLNLAGIPSVTSPESCVSLLDALKMVPTSPANRTPVAEIASPALPAAGGMLDEARSKQLFAHFQVPVAKEVAVSDAGSAIEASRAFGGRVVLKLLDDRIAHKSELGGVAVGVTADDIADCCQRMAAIVSERGWGAPQGFLIQELVTGGIEIILGLRRDPALGLYVLVGMGGTTAEILKDNAIRMLPITRSDAREMIDELRLAPILYGYRGGPTYDVEALIDAVMSFAIMGQALEDRLEEAEANPIIVRPKGEGVVAVDGLVRLT